MIQEKFWKKLSTITEVEFFSACRNIPPAFDPRTGRGEVLIQTQDEKSITLFEKGHWRSPQTQEVTTFTNAFRWQKDPKTQLLSLEHLCFGKNKPVFLFTLTPVSNHLFKSLKPHECKEDTYLGSVLFDEHYLQLTWRIIGPKKNETMTFVYY